jgi:hypothetical protein
LGDEVWGERATDNPTEDKGCDGGDGRRKTSKLRTGLALRMYRLGSRLFESGIHRDGIRLRAAGSRAACGGAWHVRLTNLRRGEGRRGMGWIRKRSTEDCCGFERREDVHCRGCAAMEESSSENIRCGCRRQRWGDKRGHGGTVRTGGGGVIPESKLSFRV